MISDMGMKTCVSWSRPMDGHQAACVITTKAAAMKVTRPEKTPAAQRLRCAHIRSATRVWHKSTARSPEALSNSQVGGVRGMIKMRIERNQRGGKTATETNEKQADIQVGRRYLPNPYLNKNFARRKGLSSSQGPMCSEYEGRRASLSWFARRGYSYGGGILSGKGSLLGGGGRSCLE